MSKEVRQTGPLFRKGLITKVLDNRIKIYTQLYFSGHI